MMIRSLRVSKAQVGSDFPFDRVYLVEAADRAQIERLFRVALVLPVDDALKAMISKIYVNNVIKEFVVAPAPEDVPF